MTPKEVLAALLHPSSKQKDHSYDVRVFVCDRMQASKICSRCATQQNSYALRPSLQPVKGPVS